MSNSSSAIRRAKRLAISLLVGTVVLGISMTSAAVDKFHNALHLGQYPEYPAINYGTGARAALLHNGEELVKAGDCIACHTEPHGTPFAGGLKINTPFGSINTPNITPDKETGIGNWSDTDFIKAMREGISPSGHYYYPAFPYPYFTKITTQDLLAIHAYLNALPAVNKPNSPSHMKFPFNWRFLQLGWRILFFERNQGLFVPNTDKSAAWNRGAYLVQGLGHCSMCHTPSYYLFSKNLPMGAPIQKYNLTGGFVDGFFAPNISQTNLKDTPVDIITRVFKANKMTTGGDVLGPMLDVNHDSLQYLTREDLEAIATYLKTVKSQIPPKPKLSKAGAGKAIYSKYCTGCHTMGAGGAPKLGDTQAWAPLIDSGINNLYTNAIAGIGGMPPKGNCLSCTNNEIQQAVDYIIDLSKPKAGEVVTAKAAPQPRASLAQGKKVYTEVCSICHDKGHLGAPVIGDQAAWAPLLRKNMDVLFLNTLRGYKNMPRRGACNACSTSEIEAAVKYMAQESGTGGNYKLW